MGGDRCTSSTRERRSLKFCEMQPVSDCLTDLIIFIIKSIVDTPKEEHPPYRFGPSYIPSGKGSSGSERSPCGALSVFITVTA